MYHFHVFLCTFTVGFDISCRFGWDVMEPICYFITFYVGVGSLMFFQLNRIEFSYPALYSALVQKKRNKLYTKRGFDIDKVRRLQVIFSDMFVLLN